jgi:hypothetical protein
MKISSLIGVITVSVLSILVGFVYGVFFKKPISPEIGDEARKWVPTIKWIGEWAATMTINDEIQLVVATNPRSPQDPITSIGYRHNRNMLLHHQDEDGDGIFEKLQFNDPVTGEIYLYFLSDQGFYRSATSEEKDKRLKEIKLAPGDHQR